MLISSENDTEQFPYLGKWALNEAICVCWRDDALTRAVFRKASGKSNLNQQLINFTTPASIIPSPILSQSIHMGYDKVKTHTHTHGAMTSLRSSFLSSKYLISVVL